jgi:hypothetical protein
MVAASTVIPTPKSATTGRAKNMCLAIMIV